jgi:hypothetical protein
VKLVPVILRLLGRTPPVSDEPNAEEELRAWALARADRQAARLRALDIQNEVQVGKRR